MVEENQPGGKKWSDLLLARRIVDVINVRAKHYWIDIRTNSMHCH